MSFVDDTMRRIADPEEWDGLDERGLLQLLFDGQLLYGATNDASMVRHLFPLYLAAMERTDVAARAECYRALEQEVEKGDVSLNALLPFLLVEADGRLVSTAALDIAMVGKPADDDPLAWPRWVAQQVAELRPANVGAVFGGLVALGDVRVNELLQPLRVLLSPDDVHVAARCTTGFPSLTAFEFWLGWLEEQPGDAEDPYWGNLASALALLARDRQRLTFTEHERPFGYLWTGQVPPGPRREWTLEEVGRHYAPRLYALEAREAPPKVMSHVLLMYGLEPRAPLGERFVAE